MKNSNLGLGLILSAMLIAGCAGTGVERPTEEGAAAPGTEAGAQPGAVSEGAQGGVGQFAGDPLEDPASPLSKRVVHFPFDSTELSQESQDLITAHAKYLAANPSVSVVLEGHADERGSREYNLGLGERRGQSVERLMLLQGAAKSQLQVVSFGEERPVSPGHDESAWQVNRRVELLYAGH